MVKIARMKKLFLTILICVQAAMLSAQTTMRVDVPNVVAADEQFNVTFIVEGDENPRDFSWSQGDDFQLVWGPQQGRSTNVQIINGKTTRSSQFTYTYILMPKKTGKFTIPAATARLKGGKQISSGTATVEVVANSGSSSAARGNQGSTRTPSPAGAISDDDLFMRFTFNRRNVVVGEPIEATLKLYQRVNIAGFEDARFPAFNGFWSQEVEAPTNIEFQRENVNGNIYYSAVLRKYVLIPQQSGTITIDPAELVCVVNVRVSPTGGASIFDSFFEDQRTIRKRVMTEPYTVNVSPLPAGAPPTFGGGVGKFGISASLSKDSLMTHEAASLVVTVKGKGNVSLLEAPEVSFPPDMEVYDTKVTERTDKNTGGTEGSKIYEYPFIPRSHGDFEIPAIRYSYYDINAGRYVTLTTSPVRFHVEKGKEDAAAQGGPVVQGVNRSGVKSLNEDIRFITTKMPSMSSKGRFFVFSTAYWISLAGLAVLAFLLWLALRKMAARRADVAGTRTRKASKMAVRRLRQAGEFLKQNLYTAFYEELHKALVGYISDKLNIAVADFSKDKVAQQLAENGISGDLAGEFVGLIDACEFARYSPDAGHDAMEAHYQTAVKVISSIESDMKKKSDTRRAAGKGKTAGTVLAAAMLLSLQIPADAAQTQYIDSLWNKATEAYSAGQWDMALQGYTSISAAGLESAPLYCNIGNAWFKLEDYPRAILYYERALKLDPSCSDARYNLGITSELIQDRIDVVPEFLLKSWARDLCYTLDSDAWAGLSIGCFAVFLAMLLLYLLSGRVAARRTGFFSAIVFILFAGMCLWFSLWQRSDYQRADSAIVMRPVSSVKSSPSSESSTDLFILHEGTKVTILDEVGDWRNICLADGRQGWMLSSDMEII